MDLSLTSLSGALEAADDLLLTGTGPAARLWATGFDLLDKALIGGFRAGELILIGGPQGLGKTTWALQVARNVARSGHPAVVLSFEHDPANLLVRLVALEAGELGGPVAPDVNRIRASFEGADGRSGSLSSRLLDTESGIEALQRVQEYGDRLLLHRCTGTGSGLDTVAAAIEQVRDRTGEVPLVVVDYLQKMHVPGSPDEHDRVTAVTEGLKDLALDHQVPVLAVAASDLEGVTTARRMRISNLRGSSALAYAADTVLLLNDKYDVVARHHLVYGTANVEEFRHWAVLTVEKNRSGRTGVEMEFRKRFDQCRFETRGRAVAEQLVDERIYVE